MAAAPQYATATFKGVSGASYTVDIYCSDVVAGLVNFDSGAGAAATSETFWTAPENCHLVDFSILTGMTDTTVLRLTANSRPLQSTIRYANHLNTLNSRPQLETGFAATTRVGMIQLA